MRAGLQGGPAASRHGRVQCGPGSGNLPGPRKKGTSIWEHLQGTLRGVRAVIRGRALSECGSAAGSDRASLLCCPPGVEKLPRLGCSLKHLGVKDLQCHCILPRSSNLAECPENFTEELCKIQQDSSTTKQRRKKTLQPSQSSPSPAENWNPWLNLCPSS